MPENSDDVFVVSPIEALHHQLMSACDERKRVRVIERLWNVLHEEYIWKTYDRMRERAFKWLNDSETFFTKRTYEEHMKNIWRTYEEHRDVRKNNLIDSETFFLKRTYIQNVRDNKENIRDSMFK